MLRVTVTGTGWPGAPSVNQYYFDAPGENPLTLASFSWGRVRDAWEQLKTLCPNYVTHTMSSEVEDINHITGVIDDSVIYVGTDPVIEGVGTALSLPPATAACLNLVTGQFKGGRKVRGRTFVSPIAQGSSDADGTPTAACLAIVAATSDIMTEDTSSGERYVVWARPRAATEEDEAVLGTMHLVSSMTMPDRFAVLRSRRD